MKAHIIIQQEYFQKNSGKYITPYRYSLSQIIFSPDKRKDNYKDASEVLEQYQYASIEELTNKGDALPFPYFFTDIDSEELALQLGSKFPDALKDQELNKWVGPIPSGFGYHLVYITDKIEPQLPSFETIKKDIVRDFEYDNQKEIDKAIYQELKKQYKIKIDIKSEDFDPKFVEYLEKELNN